MLGGVGARRGRVSSPMGRLTNANVFSLDDSIAIIGDGVIRGSTPPGRQPFKQRRRPATDSSHENFAPFPSRLNLGDIM